MDNPLIYKLIAKAIMTRELTNDEKTICKNALLRNIPSGRWMEDNNRDKSYVFICPHCKKKAYSMPNNSAKRCTLKFCPNCGRAVE